MEAGLMPHQAASDATSKHADFKVLARCGSVSQYIVANVLQCFKWSSFRHGARPELFLPCGDESWCWRLMQDLLERDKDGDVSGDVMICTDKAPCLSSRLTDLESHLIT